jgi:hypothetical protein
VAREVAMVVMVVVVMVVRKSRSTNCAAHFGKRRVYKLGAVDEANGEP